MVRLWDPSYFAVEKMGQQITCASFQATIDLDDTMIRLEDPSILVWSYRHSEPILWQPEQSCGGKKMYDKLDWCVLMFFAFQKLTSLGFLSPEKSGIYIYRHISGNLETWFVALPFLELQLGSPIAEGQLPTSIKSLGKTKAKKPKRWP